MLKTLNREIFIHSTNENYYLCIQGSKSHSFLLTMKNNRALDCGLIQTDKIALKRLFSIDELKKILENCEKNGLHCPVSNDTNKKGNIQTTVDDYEFNCYL